MTKQNQLTVKNVFDNATIRLTLVYLIIIAVICFIFNAVILVTANVNERDISIQPIEGSPRELDDTLMQRIISARDKKAGEQLTISLGFLNTFILIAGGIGSYWLAKKTLAPIEESHQMQSQFISDASHELKTPLATIQLETETLLRDPSAKKDELKEVLESNLEEARSLSSLTQMLLRLSQMDETIELTSVNINEIVQARVEKFPENEITFNATKTFLANANATAVDELTAILIENARKYKLGDEPIEVSIMRKNRQAVLEVANFSREIPAEQLNHLFDRFYRGDKARTRNSDKSGHGLGLSIAKKLVELTDASLAVRNEKFIINDKPRFKTTFSVGFHFSK